jgi:periplasmic protein TonB
MAITASVIILIILLSFYDYFSSRSWQQVTSSTRNDIVFEERNKEYGAFVIRRDYDKKMVLILLGLVLVIGSAFAVHKIIQAIPEAVIEEAPIDMTQFDLPDLPPEEEIPPPIEVEPPPPMEQTIAFIPPVVVDEVVDTPPVIQDNLVDTKVSDVTNDVAETFEAPVEKKKPPVEVKDEIEAWVDEEAQFPGGMQACYAFIGKNINYPQIAIEEGLQGKCHVSFVVDRSGAISNIKVLKGVPGCPECDKEAVRVIAKMPKWKPGKKNGKDVKSRFIVPVNYKLE